MSVMQQKFFSLVFNAHLPFIRQPDSDVVREERYLFERLSDTFIPFLKMLDHLETDRIPFKMAVSFSPTLCHMLRDEYLIEKYLAYADRQIEFGLSELDRTANDPDLNRLARFYYDTAVDNKFLFAERYQKDILSVFDVLRQKGKIEILTTAATYAFFPFCTTYSEGIQSQIEVALSSHRSYFGKNPLGFWLPELGWSPELDSFLRAYNINYTIVNSHALVLGNPPPKYGSFYPVKTPAGVEVFSNDFYAAKDVWNKQSGFVQHPLYRDDQKDVGFEIPAENLSPFIQAGWPRIPTGYKYWSKEKRKNYTQIYTVKEARKQAAEHAKVFLNNRVERLHQASLHMDVQPISVWTNNLDDFGHHWYEGIDFLEEVFRQAASRTDIQFVLPGDYLSNCLVNSYQTLLPEFSSWGTNGYAETWLDSSNDWVYRHISRSMSRMIEMAERFPDEKGLKERALNQAAREILLIQASDWPKMISNNENAEFAKHQVESSLRNFTAIFEALGSSYASPEWLTILEENNNIFPGINYRVFRKKQ
jgi:1,4-alpha-glucan branching enzyme